MATLNPREKQALKIGRIEAPRSLYQTDALLAEKEYLRCTPLLAKALWNGDIRTKYQCVQTLVNQIVHSRNIY